MNGITDYPLICVLGKLGSGKSTFTTFLGKVFEQYCNEHEIDDMKIFANYTFYDTEMYKKIKPKDVIIFPDYLKNGILILDEIRMAGGGSYDFLKPLSRKLGEFATQIRKLNLSLVYVAQSFRQVSTSLRDITYYFVKIKKLENNKTLLTFIARDGYTTLNEYEIDLTDYYQFFDTTEIITKEEIDEIEELSKKKKD